MRSVNQKFPFLLRRMKGGEEKKDEGVRLLSEGGVGGREKGGGRKARQIPAQRDSLSHFYVRLDFTFAAQQHGSFGKTRVSLFFGGRREESRVTPDACHSVLSHDGRTDEQAIDWPNFKRNNSASTIHVPINAFKCTSDCVVESQPPDRYAPFP